MPAETYQTLFRSLKKREIAPAYYLHGSEDVLKDEALRAILDCALDPALRDFNLDQRSAAQLDPEDVETLCTTLPMMADRRVVVIRDVEAWKRRTKTRTAFLRYLERPAPETVVVLVQGAGEESPDKELVKHAVAIDCAPLPTDRAVRWALHRAGTLGVTLEPDAAEHLVRCVGADLGAILAELHKLAALPDEGPVTAERVGELVGVRHGETVYDWRDAVFDGRPAAAVRLLGPLLAQPGVTGVRLVTLLGTTLVGLGLTRTHFDRRLRGSTLVDAAFKALLKARVFGLLSYKDEAARWARWAPSWPSARIRTGLAAALAADRALKSTTVSEDRAIVADLVMQLAMARQEAA
jgi:DNA polymerase III subunit delta